MKSKLTIGQSTMLRIAGSYRTINTKIIPWYPQDTVYIEGRTLDLVAQSCGPSLTALQKKGLIEFSPQLGKYACFTTAEGRDIAAMEKGKPLAFISFADQEVLRERMSNDQKEKDHA